MNSAELVATTLGGLGMGAFDANGPRTLDPYVCVGGVASESSAAFVARGLEALRSGRGRSVGLAEDGASQSLIPWWGWALGGLAVYKIWFSRPSEPAPHAHPKPGWEWVRTPEQKAMAEKVDADYREEIRRHGDRPV